MTGGERVQKPFRLLVETVERAKAAVKALKGVPEAPQSLDRLVDEAVQEKVSDLEARFNGGRPFPQLKAGERLPTTPPPGEVARIAALGRKARAAKRKKES